MATQLRSSLVLAIAAMFVLASTAWAAPSDPPAAKKAGQAAGHGSPAAPAPAKKIEPAQAADAHAAPAPKKAEASAPTGHGAAAGPTPAASHGTPAAPVRKTAKVDRKAIEADVRQVVDHINAAMKEESAKPQPKSPARAESGDHAEPGPSGPAAPARPARAAGRPRPTTLLVWDDTLKGTNVTLVWGTELASTPARDGARLVWGEEKK